MFTPPQLQYIEGLPAIGRQPASCPQQDQCLCRSPVAAPRPPLSGTNPGLASAERPQDRSSCTCQCPRHYSYCCSCCLPIAVLLNSKLQTAVSGAPSDGTVVRRLYTTDGVFGVTVGKIYEQKHEHRTGTFGTMSTACSVDLRHFVPLSCGGICRAVSCPPALNLLGEGKAASDLGRYKYDGP